MWSPTLEPSSLLVDHSSRDLEILFSASRTFVLPRFVSFRVSCGVSTCCLVSCGSCRLLGGWYFGVSKCCGEISYLGRSCARVALISCLSTLTIFWVGISGKFLTLHGQLSDLYVVRLQEIILVSRISFVRILYQEVSCTRLLNTRRGILGLYSGVSDLVLESESYFVLPI